MSALPPEIAAINLTSAQVEIIEGSRCRLYLYTHYDAANIVGIVRQVLARRKRWDDPDYCARILFRKMIDDQDKDADDGYGIGTMLYADVNVLVSLDFEKQRVHVSSAVLKSVHYDLTFSEFCDQYEASAKL